MINHSLVQFLIILFALIEKQARQGKEQKESINCQKVSKVREVFDQVRPDDEIDE
jgi:preprotein translocase subunit YajC